MKTLTVCCTMVLFMSSLMTAAPVSVDEAQTVAVNWMRYQGVSGVEALEIASCTPVHFEGSVGYHIISFAEGGFVIVSGDDVAHPLLMYSRSGTTTGTLPPALEVMLEGAAREIAGAARNNFSASPQTAALWNMLREGHQIVNTSAEPVVPPLLNTRWNQTWPYNKFCPVDPAGPSGHCYTGCGAVALAQILRYYRAPVRGNGSHTYVHPQYGQQDANFFERPYRWEYMPDRVYSSSPEHLSDEIARLMYHCGVAVEMQYGPTSSGSYRSMLCAAFKNYFRFHESASLLERTDYTREHWQSILEANLDAARPVIYAGRNSSTGSGHFFILDGYDAEGFFHCNWGWGGSYDGWFSLNDLTPGSRMFDSKHGVIVDILPVEWMETEAGTSVNLLAVDASNDAVWACGENGSVVRSSDAGWTWSTPQTPASAQTLRCVSVIDAQNAWFIGEDGSSQSTTLWMTGDAGIAWTAQLSLDAGEGTLRAVAMHDQLEGHAYADLAAGGFRIWKTSNGGVDWTPLPSASVPAALSGENGSWNNLSRSGDYVIFGTRMQSGTPRLYRSSDGGEQWNVGAVSSGIGSSVLRTTVSGEGNAWILGHGGVVCASTDGGKSWRPKVATGITIANSLTSGGGMVMAVVGEDGELRYSTDGGASWFEERLATQVDLNDIALDPEGNCWIVGDGGRIYMRCIPSANVAPPNAPLQLLPEDEDDDVTIPARLSWMRNEHAWSYEFEVSPKSDFSEITYRRSSLLDTTSRAYYLKLNTTYYWRVRCENGGGSGEWSAVRSFSTVAGKPIAPMLLSPENDAMGLTTDVSLTWLPVDGAESYHLVVEYKQLNMYVTLTEELQLMDSTFSVSGLTNGERYYWRVRAQNGMGVSPWSERWSFVTVPKLDAPTLLSPENASEEVELAPTLDWSTASGVESYFVQVALDDAFTQLVWENTEVLTPPLGSIRLQPLTTHYWRVKALAGGAASPWSNVWSFSTRAACETPALDAPTDGATEVPIPVLFEWNSVNGAEQYELQLSEGDQFTTLIINDTAITEHRLLVGDLEDLTEYFWRVRALGVAGASRWSAPWSFTTALRVPEIPALLHPEDGAENLPLICSFSWDEAGRSETYRLQVAVEESFQSTLCDTSGIIGTGCTVAGMQGRTQYYWRVAGVNSAGAGGWSVVRTFNTLDPVTVRHVPEDQEQVLILEQTFPNPVTASVSHVRFFNRNDAFVEMRLLTLLGREVRVIMRGWKQPGWHDLRFSTAELPSGVYLLHCSAGSGTAVRYLQVVR